MKDCPQCKKPSVRCQVSLFLDIPGEITHQLSKQNLRHKDVKVMGAGWPTAMHYCTACGWFMKHTP